MSWRWLVGVTGLCACRPGAPIVDSETDVVVESPSDSAAPVDVDRDGYPAPDDCDDTDASVHPGADEVCNDKDDDCDGATDSDDPSLSTMLYIDADGDGVAGTKIATCAGQPDGPDCDDADPDVHPQQKETLCTEVDDDCDGRDAGPIPMAVLADEPRVGFDGIVEALTAGGDGAHILVCPGTWRVETANIEGLTVRISSWSGDPEDTVLDAGNVTRHLLIAGAEVTLEGLTLENGEATPAGGSVMIRDSAVLIATNSVFRRNRASEFGGVLVTDGRGESLTLNFDGVRFEENAGLLYGDAVTVTATWTDVVFDGNIDIGEGLVFLTAGDVLEFTLTDATVVDNRLAIRDDGGAYFDLTGNGDAEIVIERSTFEDNDTRQAIFAISTLNGGELVLRESVFRRNEGANTSLLTADIQTDITVEDCDFSTDTDDNSSPEFSLYRQRQRDLGDGVSFSCAAFEGCDW